MAGRCRSILAWACLAGIAAKADVRFAGQVVTPNRAPLANTRIQIDVGGTAPVQAVSDVHGRFQLDVPAEGTYLVSAEHEGYFPLRNQKVELTTDAPEATLTLEPIREHTEALSVSAAPQTVDMDTSSPRRGLEGRDILNIPFGNSNDFKSALKTIPGVLRDNRGGLHINGAAEEQVLYTLNGFHLNDPLTNRFDSRFSVESVQSVEITSGNLPAEFGKGSAGVLSVRSTSGDNKFRYSGTNFFPGIENRKGLIIGDWTPRLGFSGPIHRDRAWISNSFDTQYVQTVVRDLPKGEDRSASLRFSNLLSGQVNLTSSNILHAGFLINHWNAPRTGLTALDPVETTIDRRTRQWFFHIKDQVYLARRALLEFGYADNRTFGREIPQGEGLMAFRPEGKRGFYYVDGVRNASRDQFLVHGFAPSFSLLGSHLVKAGGGYDQVTYRQSVRRTGYENFSESGKRLRRTIFGGDGRLRRANDEVSTFVQDSWRVRPGLLLELGVRNDWDRILNRWSFSPRAGVAWSPGSWSNTKVYAGLARVFDATNLRVFTRPLDQYSITSLYLDNGLATPPALAMFTIQNPRLARPRFTSVSAGGEHHGPRGLSFRVDYLGRRGRDGFSYSNTLEAPAALPDDWHPPGASMLAAVYDLYNLRLDSYRSVTITTRQRIGRQYEWMASYTRSRALSNSVVDLSIEEPVSVLSNAGPMPWDSPHRFVSWGYLPTGRKNWALSFLVDARTGFPYSVRSDGGAVVGAVNTERFPFFFELNLHLERRFVFRKHLWAFRLGANNLTGRINPDTVNNVLGSSNFQRFHGGVGRASNFRIRWLGRDTR